MGTNNYSDAFYNQRQADRKASGKSTFDYSSRVTSGAAPKYRSAGTSPSIP